MSNNNNSCCKECGGLGKVALCLAGGGSRGIIQLGMMKAWVESGLKYDMLFGTSVGALNGSLLAQGDIDVAEQLWMTIQDKDVYKWNLWNAITPWNDDCCIYDSRPLLNLCNKYIDPDKIKASPVPFYVNTTNLTDWAPLMKDLRNVPADQITQYVHASASPPVYFQPVQYDTNLLVDGGLVNNFSVQSAVDAGADTIIIFAPTKPRFFKPRNLFDALSLTISIPEYESLNLELNFIRFINKYQEAHPELRNVECRLIMPPDPLNVGLVDFSYKGLDRKSLIDLGYNLAVPVLKDLCS